MTTTNGLATRFEQANQDFIAMIEGLSTEDWQATCPNEGWSVGVTAHHVAATYGVSLQILPAMMAGDIPPLTWDMLHQANAQHAEQFAAASRDETLDLLRADGERLTTLLDGLAPDQRAQTVTLPLTGDDPVSLQAIIELFVIDHIAAHRASIEQAV